MAERIYTHAISTPIYGRTSSGTITARLTQNQISQALRSAACHKLTPGEYVRECVLRLSGVAPDPEKIVDNLMMDLGLPDSTTHEQLVLALRALLDQLDAAEGPKKRPRPAAGDEALREPPDHVALNSIGVDPPPMAVRSAPGEAERIAKMTPEQRNRYDELRAQRQREQGAVASARKAARAKRAAFDAEVEKMRRERDYNNGQ